MFLAFSADTDARICVYLCLSVLICGEIFPISVISAISVDQRQKTFAKGQE